MANYCNLRTNQEFDKTKILDILVNQLSSKYKLNATYSIEEVPNSTTKEYYIDFKIKELTLPFWMSSKKIEFYDVPETAFDRHNSKEKNEYVKNFYNSDFIYPRCFIYALLYDYIKQFLASQLNTEVDSDGAGTFKPFESNSEKYDNAQNWFKYWENKLPKSKLNKFSKIEQKFFPEFYE